MLLTIQEFEHFVHSRHALRNKIFACSQQNLHYFQLLCLFARLHNFVRFQIFSRIHGIWILAWFFEFRSQRFRSHFIILTILRLPNIALAMKFSLFAYFWQVFPNFRYTFLFNAVTNQAETFSDRSLPCVLSVI